MPEQDYHSVQIVQKFRDGTLKLDKEVLKRVLKNSWDQPTAILSVCGDKRKGKSLLINLLLHYLTRVPKNKLLAKLLGETLQSTFVWRGGPARNTEGMWILNKPITIDTKQEQIALYVMDTQGMFDNKTSIKECAQIFTLSTLMSSALIFNLLRQLQSNDIEQLSFWTKSAQWVANNDSKPVLQDLIFLIRDFPHEHLGYGLQGGKAYLEQEMGESVGNEAMSTSLEDLGKIFQNVFAYALPDPGQKVMEWNEAEKPLKMKNIDGKFRRYADELFYKLKQDVSPLKLNDNSMNGSRLYDYIEKCADFILSGEMPEPRDLSDLVADHWLQDLVRSAVADCQERMTEILKNFEDTFEALKHVFEQKKAEVLTFFDETKKFGRDVVIKDARVLLEEEIDARSNVMFSHFQKKSDAKVREADLKKSIKLFEKKLLEATEKHRSVEQKTKDLEDDIKVAEEKMKKGEPRMKERGLYANKLDQHRKAQKDASKHLVKQTGDHGKVLQNSKKESRKELNSETVEGMNKDKGTNLRDHNERSEKRQTYVVRKENLETKVCDASTQYQDQDHSNGTYL